LIKHLVMVDFVNNVSWTNVIFKINWHFKIRKNSWILRIFKIRKIRILILNLWWCNALHTFNSSVVVCTLCLAEYTIRVVVLQLLPTKTSLPVILLTEGAFHAKQRDTIARKKMLSVGIIILIVLMVLCALLGSIYAYIYLTRINPQCLRRFHGPPKHRGLYSDPGGSNMDDDTLNATASLTPSTHMFLFRK